MVSGAGRKTSAFFRGFLFIATVLAGLWTLPAQAVIITVGGVDYDVELSAGGLPLTGQPAEVFVSPWWGSEALATEAANNFHTATSGNYGAGITSAVFVFDSTGPLLGDSLSYVFVRNSDGVVRGPVSHPNTTSYVQDAAVAYVPIVAAVPEIDGNALAKALFILFALGAWLDVRRRRSG